jgi:8-oxo-dGTP pyrophosphatase MutT (NUDIX family)
MQRHRSSAVCLANGKILIVELVDPISGRVYLLPPGGQIEPNESPAQAAIRETLEETGYQVVPLQIPGEVAEYGFHWSGQNFECTTELIAVTLKNPDELNDPIEPAEETPYITKTVWLPIEDSLQHMKFIPELHDATKALLLKMLEN